jgi:hypothetical protein
MTGIAVPSASLVERLLAEYPREERTFVYSTNKLNVLAYISRLAATIEEMDDFDLRFPEGTPGVVLYVMLADASYGCPDVGDFNYVHQGFERILRATLSVAGERFD